MTDLTRRRVLTGAGTAISLAAIAGCTSNSNSGASHVVTSPGTGVPSTNSAGPTPTAAGTSTSASAGASLELQAGPLSEVPVGGAKLVTVDGHDLILTQAAAGQPSVFMNRCTHLGCKIGIEGSALVCPCHASKFDLAGKVLQGPATAPLTEGSLRVDNGQIIVEKV
ncbi:MAG: hypothetical protein QOG52_125 [Frankiaceae bacterium]|nr:hypothetical protein [Frankiaceae bacterium]